MIIGIIIPAYNCADSIEATLRSVQNLRSQCSNDIFCVVIDDASIDGTSRILHKYISNGTINYIKTNQTNLGVAASRNIGINTCKHTDYITFLDSDDELTTEAAKAINSVNDGDIINFSYIRQEPGNRRRITHPISEGNLTTIEHLAYLKEYLITPNKMHLWVTCWGKLFSTRLLNNNNVYFRHQMHLYEDVEFNFQCLKCANKINYSAIDFYIHHTPTGLQAIGSKGTFGGNTQIRKMYSFGRALATLRSLLKQHTPKTELNHLIYHCIAAYTSITTIRATIRINSIPKLIETYAEIKSVLLHGNYTSSYNHYSATHAQGNRVLPFLLRNRLFFLGTLYATFLARKRYAKLIK